MKNQAKLFRVSVLVKTTGKGFDEYALEDTVKDLLTGDEISVKEIYVKDVST